MTESTKYRKELIERVARLTERLQALEESLSTEPDERRRRDYETEKADIMEKLRQARHKWRLCLDVAALSFYATFRFDRAFRFLDFGAVFLRAGLSCG